MLLALLHYRGLHQRGANQELVVNAVQLHTIGIVKVIKQRTHDGGSVLLLGIPQLVQVGQQLVAQAHIVANDLQCLGPKHPGLLLGCARAGVVAQKGEQAAGLVPGDGEVFVGMAAKAGHIGPIERNARQSEIQTAMNGGAQVVPVAEVVACPHRREAAGPGRRAARQQERTLVGLGGQKAVARALGHAGAVLVVVGPVRPLAPVKTHVVQLGRARAGVVHIQPGTVKARLSESLGVGGPPVAAFGNGIVGKPGAAWPHKAYKRLALGVVAEDVGGLAAEGHLVTRFYFHAGVQNRNDAATLGLQACQVGFQIAKMVGVGGEHFVVVHVVNVEP